MVSMSGFGWVLVKVSDVGLGLDSDMNIMNLGLVVSPQHPQHYNVKIDVEIDWDMDTLVRCQKSSGFMREEVYVRYDKSVV
jgi:hypothetical protein